MKNRRGKKLHNFKTKVYFCFSCKKISYSQNIVQFEGTLKLNLSEGCQVSVCLFKFMIHDFCNDSETSRRWFISFISFRGLNSIQHNSTFHANKVCKIFLLAGNYLKIVLMLVRPIQFLCDSMLLVSKEIKTDSIFNELLNKFIR